MDNMKVPRLGFGAALLRNKTYIAVSGGYTSGFKLTSETEIYNVTTNAWQRTPSMKEVRNAHSLCELGNGQFLYAFGG